MKDTLERWLGTVFGLVFVALSLLVAVETAMRKLFNISLQGADELGGYALAVGATIAFSLALLGRNHIRVDVFHEHLPRRLQTVLNWLSAVSMASFAALMAWLAWYVIQDSRAYQSVSQTPWATPLVYPQTVWLIGLILFGALAVGIAAVATWQLLSGRSDALNTMLHPRSTREEIKEELDDLQQRGTAADTLPTSNHAPSIQAGAA
ncbi:TRAP-type mannitol/chloroaromatic compound transport system permease small subunit [Acidovorax temperans]|uniref:TRAP transporter small permease protein n=1 Tax=Acidovorax temperans TaxID=80878 RepID=A0A543KWJ9_9BURK|nr:TRAP transporter small permease [Acidovorax temperans]TQM99450.1 TRAP-type mannitol/chloroaromatic compound transport system permease small subunit [Acidovorax temperans]